MDRSLKSNWYVRVLWFAILLGAVNFVFVNNIWADYAWELGKDHRFAELHSGAGAAGFLHLANAELGIAFTNRIDRARYTTNQIYLNGSGVALGDVDRDGWCDIYLAGLGGGSALYRNLGGWKFENVTASSGLSVPGFDATGAAFGDLNGDGNLDLIVNSIGQGTLVYLNDGKGHFSLIATLNPGKAGMSLALADIDGNGTLDLYLANYRTITIRDEPEARITGDYIDGRPVIAKYNGRLTSSPELFGRFTLDPKGKIIEHGEIDALYLNDGNGKFTSVDFADGTFLDESSKPLAIYPFDWGLSVMFRDINGDGAPDLYVCNDFASEDRIWINTGRGKFRALNREALRKTSMFSMGIDFADVNRDGADDFFVVDMLSRSHGRRMVQTANVPPTVLEPGQIFNRPQYSYNTFFYNRGDGTFAEVAHFLDVQGSEWSWCPIFLDVDLDGYEDLLISNGHERDAMNMDVINLAQRLKSQKKMIPSEMLELQNLFDKLNVPNVAFHNEGGTGFREVGKEWGFNLVGVSQGMALGDLDNDGDMDVVINNLNGAPGIYRNEGSGARVAVRLKGKGGNSQGIGAKIIVRGGPVEQSQEMICGGRYLSGDQAQRVFAAGKADNEHMEIEVRWRDGMRSLVKGVKANRIYEIEESEAEPFVTGEPEKKAVFRDVSELLGHRHVDEPYDDFARQPLLPHRLSQSGPGVAWQDLNGDGWEDLIIGGGKGGRMSVYENNGKGGFKLMDLPFLQRILSRDQTGLAVSGSTVVAGSANYEDGLTNGGWIRVYDMARKVGGENMPGPEASTGPLALADVDGDGDLDLFVGGRTIAGRYPEAATSLLMKNEGGHLVPGQKWEKLGLASGAVFTDLNGDGYPELVVACEWGPLRVFLNEEGQFREVTGEMGLSQWKGWWNGVTAGDLDGDGRMDLIASNWGLNTKYHASEREPLRIYFGDGGGGVMDLIESDWEEGKEVPVHGFRMMSAAFPELMEKVKSYQQYGQGSVEELFGGQLKKMGHLEVNELRSMLFLNRGDHFEAVPLPEQAQWTPGFGVNVGDLDGDGNEDLFLSQNLFATHPDIERQDAGRGLWMKGDGKGGLKAVGGQESGIKVYGEQRGSALCDYDGDGRVDLVVTQNGNETKLYHNEGAKPGLRVKLKGGVGNASGVGVRMRLIYQDGRKGPMREVHAGSGYLSQDSAVEVLGEAGVPKELWLCWPGGKVHTVQVPPHSTGLEVDALGNSRTIQ